MLFPEMTENPWRTSPPEDPTSRPHSGLTTLELCAGGGGQALGYDQAGIEHAGLVELDKHACATLRLNRPKWNVIEQDLNQFDGSSFNGVEIISGGLPCPPFSIAGKQLGKKDERNLFPAMIRLVDHIRPRAVMIRMSAEYLTQYLATTAGDDQHPRRELRRPRQRFSEFD